MSNFENELKDLRDKNNELVQKVQYWKMTAAQRENEKLELMKEINELRLRLSRIRSGGAAQARKLDAALHATSEEALSHLVQASSAVARSIEIAKTYMQDRQELDTMIPRWSSIGNTPSSDRVHRVHPLAIGGQSIQPVVSLSRTILNTSNTNSSQNNLTERAVPMHMLQDLYIPLTRIDLTDLSNINNLRISNRFMDTSQNNSNNSTEDLGLDESSEQADEAQNISETEEFDESRRLDAVTEDMEPEEEEAPVSRPVMENPFEGPSWMLDGQNKEQRPKRTNLEPDSTTEPDVQSRSEPGPSNRNLNAGAPASEFSPTVRRRKRPSSPPPSPHTPRPPYSPRPPARRNSHSGRVLKVLVAKMRLDDDVNADVSPPKRQSLDAAQRSPPARQARDSRSPSIRLSRDNERLLTAFDAPSPNGATDAHVIVSESSADRLDPLASGEPSTVARKVSKRDYRTSHDSRSTTRISLDNRGRISHDRANASREGVNTSQDRRADVRGSQDSRGEDSRTSHNGQDSDSGSGSEVAGEGRTRRPRKAVTYKEKPLNSLKGVAAGTHWIHEATNLALKSSNALVTDFEHIGSCGGDRVPLVES